MKKQYEKKPEGYLSHKGKEKVVITIEDDFEEEYEWGSFTEANDSHSNGGYMSDAEHGPGSGLY